MRPLLLALVVALAAAGAAHAQTVETRDAPWAPVQVSEDGRTVTLVYEGGGCKLEDGRAEVTETARTVTITVAQSVQTGEGVVCTEELAYLPLEVELDAPLDGRRLAGGPDFASGPARPERMPQVVGMHVDDARRALRTTGLAVEAPADGAVASQAPAAGAPLQRATEVILGVEAVAPLKVTVRGRPTRERLRREGLRFTYAGASVAGSAVLRCGGRVVGRRSTNVGSATKVLPVRRLRGATRCRLVVRAQDQRGVARFTLD